MAIALQPFIQKHPPGRNLKKADRAKVSRYRQHLPNSLLELWTEFGFGLYGHGLIQLIDPDLYRENLWGWLMREEEDMTRLPIAVSAFGEIYYYRKLSEEGDEDVSFIDPHTSETGDIAWSLEDFFNEWCCNEESISDFLNPPLLQEAVSAKGNLENDQMFYFVPALRLGGKRIAANIDRGDSVAHLNLLLRLALE